MQTIELRRSRWLAMGLGAGVALALAAIARAALPAWIQGGLGLLVLGAALQGWRRAQVATALRLDSDGGLQVRNERGEWVAAEVQGDSLVTRVLVVLRYRVAGRRTETRVILPDSAPADAIRRLRVSLRWARHRRSDTASPGAD